MKSPKLIWRLVQSTPIAIILAVTPLNSLTAQATAQVVIGEVAWAGSSLSIADEWLELWNTGDEDLPLSGYSLLGAASNPLLLPDDAIISAGKTFLIANYAEDDPKSALNVRPDLVSSALSLSNSSLQIILLDDNGAQISTVGDGAVPPAGSNANPKSTMVSAADIWITTMASTGFDAGVLDLGTPGLCDGCALKEESVPAAENATLPQMENDTTNAENPTVQNENNSLLNDLIMQSLPIDAVTSTNLEVETVPANQEAPSADNPIPNYDVVISNENATSATTAQPPNSETAATSTKVNPPDEAEPKADLQESEVTPDPINPCQDFPILKVSLPIATTTPLIVETFNSAENSPEILVVSAIASSTTQGPAMENPASPAEPDSVTAEPDSVTAEPDSVTAEPDSVATNTQPAIEIGDESDGAHLNSSSTDSNASSTEPALTSLETPQNNDSETTPVIAQVILNTVVDQTPLDGAEENAAATAIITEQITNMTTTTPLTTDVSPNIATDTNIILQTASAPLETPDYQLIKLNEIMPYPAEGKEWIEITSLDLSRDIPLTGLQIKDRTGTIYTFVDGIVNAANPFYVVELASAKLNNDGDTVTLYDPNGNLLDGLDYDKSQKDLSWSRYPDGTGSWQTGTATKKLKNVGVAMSDPTPIIESPASEVAATTTAISVQETTVNEPVNGGTGSVSLANAASSIQNASKVSSTSPVAPTLGKTGSVEIAKVSLKSNTAPQAAKATSTAKTTSKKTTTSTMTTSNKTPDIRLVIQGTVGSPPGLLPYHRFVLLSPDGRGLLISVPTTQQLPALNQLVELSGTLHFGDDGVPIVKLGSKDQWRELTATTTQDMALRKVNFIAPSEEDAWSLVEITGTVRKVSGKVVTLDYEGADVEVEINPETDYRVSRLAIGDSVKIIGLLDLSKTLPRIIPRQTDDISLLKHAPPKEDAATEPIIPNWTPLGAAGVAIAGTEGFKQLRERRKRRTLEKILETEIT
ncbi:lamin tail domain-containing protein [Patescibacteria group bacterium]|nr:lamin tail domain-containing protein [Patescibacteria group bacterium]